MTQQLGATSPPPPLNAAPPSPAARTKLLLSGDTTDTAAARTMQQRIGLVWEFRAFVQPLRLVSRITLHCSWTPSFGSRIPMVPR